MSVFQHSDYKDYLREKAEERGSKSAWAEAIGCQRGYVTAVLSGSAHFSLEQADNLAEHLGHNEDERDCFLLLVQMARAGTPRLRKHFEEKLDELRERRNLLRTRYKSSQALTLEQKVTFYSSWHYSAIHICLFTGLVTRDAIAERLRLPLAKVNEALDFLLSAGFATEKSGGHLEGRFPQTFLAGDSPLITKHHMNWRLQAIRSIDANVASDLHYSSIFGVAKADLESLRALLLETIDRFKKTVSASTNETEVWALTLDLFGV